jgi:hypothetical protein
MLQTRLKMNLQEVGEQLHGLDLSGCGYGHVVGAFEYGNEP